MPKEKITIMADKKTLKDNKGEHPYGDAGQLILLVIFLAVWISDSFFLHETTFLSNYIPSYIRMSITAVLVAMALLLFRSTHFMVSGKQRPNYVVANGAYKYIRHPMYLAAILGYLGTAISSFSLASLLLIFGIFVFYDYIAGYEEKLLEIKFGEKYKAYEQRTGKWLPRVG